MSYVGFTEDGAQWLVDNTDIKLVGKEYWYCQQLCRLSVCYVMTPKYWYCQLCRS
jgi:hypothetical protein